MENNILQVLADNPSLLAATRAVIEKQFDVQSVSADLDDMVLGQFLRARITGLAAVEKAFQEIARYRSTKKGEEVKNPAR